MIGLLLGSLPEAAVEEFRQALERLSDDPEPHEKLEQLDERAQGVMKRIGWRGASR